MPTFNGTSGANTINGTSTADTIIGNGGNDTLLGGAGSDTYIYAKGDGNDVIREVGNSADTDTLRFTNLFASDVTLSRSLVDINDLLVTINATGEVITVDQHFLDNAHGLERLQFADGAIWTRTQIQAAAWFRGTSAGETISGTTGNDTIVGNGGNDVLVGSYGADTYVYALGDGNDTIRDDGTDGLTDTLQFTNLKKSDITLSYSFAPNHGSDLRIIINATGQEIIDDSHFSSSSRGIDRIQFADGMVWNRADMQAHVSFIGTAGNDVIEASSGDDTIVGGRGDDLVSGGQGADTYVYALGDGNDIIKDNGTDSQLDTLRFTDLNAADVTFALSSTPNQESDLRIIINATGEEIRDTEHFIDLTHGIDRVQFADGTVWDRAQIKAHLGLIGTSGDDVIDDTVGADLIVGGMGNDTLFGREGGDTYVYAWGDGNDVIVDPGHGAGDTDVDTLRFIGVNAGDVTLLRGNDDLKIKINGTGQAILDSGHFADASHGVDRIQFADGTVWDRATIDYAATHHAPTGQVVLSGPAAEHAVLTANTSTIQDDDDLGPFHYGWERSFDGTTWTQVGGDQATYALTAVDIGARVRVTVSYVDGFGTAESLTSSPSAPVANVNDAPVAATDSATVDEGAIGTGNLLGNDSDVDSGDHLLVQSVTYGTLTRTVAAGGSAEIAGTYGTLAVGSDGSFSYRAANVSGPDLLPGDTATDTFTYTVRDDAGATATATLTVNVTGTVVGFLGTSVADAINGTGGDDTIVGRGGNDILAGGEGSDTYVYAAGDGNDTIRESATAGVDVLSLADLNAADVTLSRLISVPATNNLVVRVNATGETITVENHFGSSSSGLEQIRFADGTTWDRGQIQANAWLSGTSAGETINGTSGADTIAGAGGADTLSGGQGSDTYVWAAGDGNDTIRDQGTSASDVDTLRFSDVNASDVRLVHTSGTSDLEVRVLAIGGATITVSSHFSGAQGLEQIVFADGTVWDPAAIEYASTHHAPTGLALLPDPAIEDREAYALMGFFSDLDGIGTLHFQWQRSADGLNWSNIGTDSSTYRLGDDDVGMRVRYTVSYTDGVGTLESLTSNEIGPVANVNDVPIAHNDVAAVDEDALATGNVLANDTDVDHGDHLRLDSVSHDGTSQAVGAGGSAELAGTYGTLAFGSDGSYTYSPNNAAAHDILPGETASDVFTYLVTDDQGATATATLTFTITGTANSFVGTAGDDTLVGTLGDDTFDAGAGNDWLTGRGGHDTFAFHAGFGQDTITDFAAGDVIAFDHDVFADFAAVQAAATSNGADTVITVDATTTLTLQNVALASLTENDFLFR